MLSIRVICVGKYKEQFYADAADEYIKRLGGHCRLEIVEIPEYRIEAGCTGSAKYAINNSQLTVGRKDLKNNSAQVETALDKERAAIVKKLPVGAKVIALCIEGREYDSQGLSELLMNFAGSGSSRLCFIIGGSFGLHEELKNMADVKLSMSKMTFPHNLARVMLLEQLYRAFKIAEGGKYHK